MSVQVNYVCWTSSNVTATIPTEAATPSDAVLLATHAPLRIRRQAGAVVDDSAKLVTESDVLDEFLTKEPNNGVLVAPVLGESGAGKSHLIRWVNAKIPTKTGPAGRLSAEDPDQPQGRHRGASGRPARSRTR